MQCSHQKTIEIGNSHSSVAVNRDGNILVVHSGRIDVISSTGNKIMSMMSEELDLLFCPRITIDKGSNMLFILENLIIFLLCASTLKFRSALIRLSFAASDIASYHSSGVVTVYVADSASRHIYALKWKRQVLQGLPEDEGRTIQRQVLEKFCVLTEDKGRTIQRQVLERLTEDEGTIQRQVLERFCVFTEDEGCTIQRQVLETFCMLTEDEGRTIRLTVGPAGKVYTGSHKTISIYSPRGEPLQYITREGKGFSGIRGLAVECTLVRV